jgi:hypothetical protein
VQVQGAQEQPSSPASESSSLSSETATFFVNGALASPSTPTSSHSSDELWAQVEDLSALVDRIELPDSSV